MKKILVVEDEQNIREFEVINLKRSGYQVEEADCAESALALYDAEPEDFAIALLDISMPGMDGFELCKRLRAKSAKLGIIMLTARTMEMDKVNGLMLGADDYITKPFSPSELCARVDSLYRRVALQGEVEAPPAEQITLGRFTLNTRKHTLLKDGVKIELTKREYGIIECLFRNPDKLISRSEIFDATWEQSEDREEKLVDVNVRRIRMKIEDDPSVPKHLLTVWGRGYKWSTGK